MPPKYSPTPIRMGEFMDAGQALKETAELAYKAAKTDKEKKAIDDVCSFWAKFLTIISLNSETVENPVPENIRRRFDA